MDANNKHELKQGLSNRHIQLIALGGAIGTGLFLGLSQTIKLAGPSILLGYAIAGIIAFLIMRHLGEMVVEEPVSGSLIYAELSGDFPLGDSRQPIYKSLRPFDLVS